MYVYIQSEPGLWTVGFYDPQGEWQAESDWGAAEEAASRASWLNGAAAPGQEAVAWIGEQDIITQDKARSDYWKLQDWKCIPLYLAPPTSTAIATASQESAPEAGGEARPVAYRAWLDDERGARFVFTLWPEEEHLEVIWEPLFLAPPTSTAIAARVIRQAAEACEKVRQQSDNIKQSETCSAIKTLILALTPAAAEAELEALMMKAVDYAFDAARKPGRHWEQRPAIVRRVLDEMKGG
jgi:hypothetical protein